jgi:ketosteroid isomerase-like protein
MRNLSMFGFIVLVAMVLTVRPLLAGDDMEKVKEQLEEINMEFTKANIDGDLEKIYSYYSDDAVFMPNYGPMAKGKSKMIQEEKEMRDSGFKIHSFNLNTMEVWGCGNMVYETGTYGISLTLPGMGNPVPDNGKYLTVWQKDSDGSLKIKYDIWNTDMNPWQMGQEMGEDEEMGGGESNE